MFGQGACQELRLCLVHREYSETAIELPIGTTMRSYANNFLVAHKCFPLTDNNTDTTYHKHTISATQTNNYTKLIT